MADVFISYSKVRSAVASELAGELAELGYEVWWDTSLLPTGSYGAEIDRQLDAAKAVIVIWSPESLRSKWVKSEAQHGDRQDKLVNTHTAEPGIVAAIPKPLDLIHSVGVDEIRAIVGALDRLGVPRSAARRPTQPVVPVSAVDADNRLFAEVEKAGTVEALQFYLDEFPQGVHAPVVRFRLKAAKDRVAAADAENQRRQTEAEVARFRAEGRIPVRVTDGAAEKALWPKPGAGETLQDCWLQDGKRICGPELVVVPAGRFVMGSNDYDDEKPPHEVTIAQPFAVGRYAVTFDEWEAAQAHPDWQKLSGIAPRQPKDYAWGRGRRPVIDVNWDDASTYCRWLSRVTAQSYRLLSEAEWEYACRAGTTNAYCFGDMITNAQAQYWQGATVSADGTVEVGQFLRNSYGLYDMHGNVFEWCGDLWHDDYNGAPSDGSVWLGSGDANRRVVRGGSWGDSLRLLRSPYRDRGTLDYRGSYVGFRLARTLNP